MNTGDRLTLTVDRPAAGGRMIARHEGAIVFVSGAIPGEVVEADVERVQRGTVWAQAVRILQPSGDRVPVRGDWACGGNVLAHVAYERQLAIKRDIIRDAFMRIGRMPLPAEIDVAASPPAGYRMRARLHVVQGRIGFFREGTHTLCDAAGTDQLLPESTDVIRAFEQTLAQLPFVNELEVSENCAGDQRAVHLSLRDGSDPSRLASFPPMSGVRGLSYGPSLATRPLVLWGIPEVTDTIHVSTQSGEVPFTVTRQAHSFFQGNRYLLSALVTAVVDHVSENRVLDLYAGVGVFSIALAVRGHEVIAIEGDRTAAQDLKNNAARSGGDIEPRHQSVEAFLRTRHLPAIDAVIVDPPRTGMTKDALKGALAIRPLRLVYVSCDVATLARDARIIVDNGYRVTHVRAFDLFPNTAHVETLVVFTNGAS